MYIVVGSATTAERLRKAIERTIGFPAYVVKTPPQIRSGGCSYSVRVDDRALGVINQVFRDTGISYKKIYTVKKENGESVYNAVS